MYFFVSVVLTNNLTEDDIDRYYIIPDTTTSATANGASGETTHARKEVTPATSPTSSAQAYIGLITGALAMVVLLLGCTIFLMIRRGKKKVSNNIIPSEMCYFNLEVSTGHELHFTQSS